MALFWRRGVESALFSGKLRDQLRGAYGIYLVTTQALGLLDQALADEWR